jgi:hypothetical protein
VSAKDILRLYEDRGPAIFDQQHGMVRNWLRQRWHNARHWFGSKYEATELHAALRDILGEHRLGESKTRLLIPAWHPMLEKVYNWLMVGFGRITPLGWPWSKRLDLARGPPSRSAKVSVPGDSHRQSTGLLPILD